MSASPVLIGEITRLRLFKRGDVPLLAQWLFDPDVNRWLQLSEDPPEFRTEQAVFERFDRMQSDSGCQMWLVETSEGQPVGHVDMVDIHSLQRRAEIHVSIGVREARGKGYGSDAIRSVVKHAFEEMGLRRLFLIVDEDNAAAIACYEKVGFVREGLLRAHRTRYGEPINMIVMGIVAPREEVFP